MLLLKIVLMLGSIGPVYSKRKVEDLSFGGKAMQATVSSHHIVNAHLSENVEGSHDTHHQSEAGTQTAQPDWLLAIHGTPCMNPQFTPYQENGISSVVAHADLEKLKKEAMLLAKHEGCKLCTVYLARGKAMVKNAADQSRVICTLNEKDTDLSAKQLGFKLKRTKVTQEEACLNYVGRASNFVHSPDTCMPCPGFCKLCIMQHHMFHAKSFTCITQGSKDLKAPARKRKLKKLGLDGVHVENPLAGGLPSEQFHCADVYTKEPTQIYEGIDKKTKKILQGSTSREVVNGYWLDGWGSGWGWQVLSCKWMTTSSTQKPRDFRPTDFKSAPPLASALILDLISCRSTAEAMGSSEVFAQVSNKLKAIVEEQNCEVCTLSLISEHGGQPQVTEAKCEMDDIGVAACSREHGPGGWSKKHLCAPCPPQCLSCEHRSDTLFKCLLATHRPVEKSVLAPFLEAGALNDEPWTIPPGFSCGTPEMRKSDARQWKVYCEYKTKYGSMP